MAMSHNQCLRPKARGTKKVDIYLMPLSFMLEMVIYGDGDISELVLTLRDETKEKD